MLQTPGYEAGALRAPHPSQTAFRGALVQVSVGRMAFQKGGAVNSSAVYLIASSTGFIGVCLAEGHFFSKAA